MGSFLDTEISGVLINSVASEEVLKEIEDAGLLEPNKIYLTPDEDEQSGWTTLYNIGITSTGNYTLADNLSKFDTICIMGYYIISGKYYYVTTMLPVWQFKVISEGVLIHFDSRFASVGCVNDTTIKVAEISNMYILRIFGK
jgi:hypothetical protein